MFSMMDFQEMFPLNTRMFYSLLWAILVVASFAHFNPRHKTWVSIVIGSIFGGVAFYVLEDSEYMDYFLNGEVCVFIYYPIFVLKIVYGMDTYLFMKSLPQIMLIVLTGFLFTILSAGFIFDYVEGANLSPLAILVTGVSFFLYDIPWMSVDFETMNNLQNLCEGEAVFSATLVIITHQLIFGLEYDYINKWYHIVLLYVRYIILSILVGVIFGKLTLTFKHFLDDTLGGVMAYLGYTYIIFVVCESILYCSGILACIIFIFYIPKEKSKLTEQVSIEIKVFINTIFDMTHSLLTVALSVYLSYYFCKHFNTYNLLVAISVYVFTRVVRIFHLLNLTPLLRKLGSGFDLSSYIAMVSSTRNGLGLLISVLILIRSPILHKEHVRLTNVACIYAVLSHTINGSLLKAVLNKYKLLEMSTSTRINISAGISLLGDKQNKMVSILKMNRFFSDSNWPVINECTKISNPFKTYTDGDEQNVGIRQITCTNCFKKIYVEPTKKEFGGMSSDAHYRVVKGIRLSLNRQHDHGILTETEVYKLIKSVNSAEESQEIYPKINDFYKLFKIPKIIEKMKLILYKLQRNQILMKPKKPFRAFCFVLFNSLYYKIFLAIVILWQMLLISLIFFTLKLTHDWSWNENVYLACDLLWVLDIIIKVNGYSTTTIREGVRYYFRNHWNKIDLATLIISIICTIVKSTYESTHISLYILWIFNIFRYLRITRVLRVIELFENIYPKLLDFCDGRIERKIACAYTLSVAIITAYEEVIEKMESLIDSPFIRKTIKEKLESDKMDLIEYVGGVIKRWPGVAIRVQTKQAVFSILKQTSKGIQDLRINGYIDSYEFEKLSTTLDKHYKSININKYDQFVLPKQVFSEIVYLSGDSETINFLYENVTTKIWNAGDIICNVGDVIEGMFKITYIPNPQAIQLLTKYGLLPIKDFLVNARFLDEQTEYVFVGNSIGELSVLTGREYSCRIISLTSSQAFIISRQCMWQAIENSQDPVNGLAPRMWKFLSQSLARRILMNVPFYKPVTDDDLSYILDRSIMPELGAYKNVQFSDMMEDIILIEGFLIDTNTKYVYKAPCFLPRSLQNATLPKYSDLKLSTVVETRIMIIPMFEIDEYEVILRMEQNSDINKHAPSRYLLSNNLKVKRKRKRRLHIHSRIKRSFVTKGSQLTLDHE